MKGAGTITIGLAVAAALVAPSAAGRADAPAPGPRVGDTYEITLTRDSVQHGSDGFSSGSSHDQDMIVERIIAVRDDGRELEYDLPRSIPAGERAKTWQLPARVFKPNGGPMQLLNGPALERRVDAWLKRAHWTRAVCGHWIFTWNAFRIECDPASVIRMIEPFDLRTPDIREGASYREDRARSPVPLARQKSGTAGAVFTAEMQINPDAVLRSRAEADVVIGEITRKPVTLEAALRERSKEAVSGILRVRFETDAAGNVWRRTKLATIESRKPSGESETETISETTERRLISGAR